MIKALKFLLGFIALIAYELFLDRSGIDKAALEQAEGMVTAWRYKGASGQ